MMLALLISVGAQSLANAQSDEYAQADTDFKKTSADLEQAFQSVLDDYKAKVASESSQSLQLGEIHCDGTWAYVVAQPEDNKDDLYNFAVLLAYRDEKGWQATAPLPDLSEIYNEMLNQFPETLIDESTKAYLQLPVLSVSTEAITANFTGHLLPFPAGKNGYVPKKDGSGHENQVDFNISPGDTIYASKPGTVVFVKESSNASCLIPPPDPCWQRANMVVVQHGSSEYSWYVHLAFNSVPVNVGSYVGRGTKIGVEGSTGYSSGVHLHYMVSTDHTKWTDPNDPNAAPWGTGITAVDFDEVAWNNIQVGGTYTSRNTSDPGVVSWGNGRLDLFVHGEDNVLWQKTYNGSWGNWTSLGGVLVSSPDAASWGNGHIDVYVRGLDNNIYYKRYLNGSWANWASAGQPSVRAISDPSAVSQGTGRIDLFVRGGDNALWHRPYSNGSWGNWESLGGVLTTGPDAASPASGQMQVFLAGLNKVMWRCTYNSGACTWDQVPGGASSYDQSGVSPSTNRVDVFARGTDGQLYHRIWNGSWGNWENLGGFLTSGPDAASYRVNNHLDVFVRGSDNNVYHRWKDTGGWSGWEWLGSSP